MRDTVYLIMNSRGVTHMRKTKPRLSGGEVAVCLRVDIDNEYFARSIPAVDMALSAVDLIEPDIDIEVVSEHKP